jgi:hypothetical protein
MGSPRRILHTLAAASLAVALSTGCVARTRGGRAAVNAVSTAAVLGGLIAATYGVVRATKDPGPCIPEGPLGCTFHGLDEKLGGIPFMVVGLLSVEIGGVELLVNNRNPLPDDAPVAEPPPAPKQRVRLPFLPGT